jgi:hypothetical protein
MFVRSIAILRFAARVTLVGAVALAAGLPTAGSSPTRIPRS